MTAVAATQKALDAAEANCGLGLNAFITVDRQGALAAAAASDERRCTGRALGPLDGVPVAVKDNIDTAGLATTRGSGLYVDRVPERDAVAVERLRAAGMVVIGKSHLGELACGSEGRNEFFGDCLNPHDVERWPGGSSSGSAAAVGAGIVALALGSDTSCSVRAPASFCGVVGLKPTFGRISTAGVSVLSARVDHVGLIASNVGLVAAGLAALQEAGWGDPSRALGVLGPAYRVGVLGGDFVDTCTPDVQAVFERAVAIFEADGAHLSDVHLDVDLAEADAQCNVLCVDMVAAYGADVWSRSEVVGRDVLDWFDVFQQGVEVETRDQALSLQSMLRVHVGRLFDQTDCDVMVCPTTRSGADLLSTVRHDRMLRVGNLAIWNMTGQPSITVPCGTDANAMPLGLLITGRLGADDKVLAVAERFEAAMASYTRANE